MTEGEDWVSIPVRPRTTLTMEASGVACHKLLFFQVNVFTD